MGGNYNSTREEGDKKEEQLKQKKEKEIRNLKKGMQKTKTKTECTHLWNH